ncbi:leucine-rich repeat-containing protein 27-like [Leptidea sinapis]|uniref:leucine-rich repeat-containing protein 27-like n=1 Tax=Leptidea sinapis TaxID=189913 RepID=UPI0021463193|nr:leucine-rich repeat-containing protein 27-like [Leptidea sinapis]
MSYINLYLSAERHGKDTGEDTILDLSSHQLESVPDITIKYLHVLYLQDNKIEELPNDFFPTLPYLTWLDLRNNRLMEIPKSVRNHQNLTHLLLQNNLLQEIPNELGSLGTLKVLQLNGNPLSYPPKDIVSGGTSKIVRFLNNKLIESELLRSTSAVSDKTCDTTNETNNYEIYGAEARSYNSVLDINDMDKITKTLSVRFSEKDDDSEEEYYGKNKGKCPKLARSRYKTLSPHCQSAKYVKPIVTGSKAARDGEIIEKCVSDLAVRKRKEFMAKTEKILQSRKNLEGLRKWRTNYRNHQLLGGERSYKMDRSTIPFDTNPDYMTFLTREDIEKDLPDKYKKKLVKRCRPSVARKSNEGVHLAMKIKQLFENLEALDVDKKGMTPRTEQRLLLNEIQKITEIKQKLMELTLTNSRTVPAD